MNSSRSRTGNLRAAIDKGDFHLSNEVILADAISNSPEAQSTVLLPAQDLTAILKEVQNLREIAKEHEWRLNKHSESILTENC